MLPCREGVSKGKGEGCARETLGERGGDLAPPEGFVGRRWNRFKSAAYTRVPAVTELYGKYRGAGEGPEMPALASLRGAVATSRVALLTSAGVHLRHQPAYDMHDPDGDATFRIIPADVGEADLTITHDYYDHGAADRDVNCVFPLFRLREMARDGEIGAVAPRHVAFMGHILGERRRALVEETGPAMAAVFEADEVDAVLTSPG